MSKKTYNQAVKRYERARKEYMEACDALRHEEELKAAMEWQPKINLFNVNQYSAYYQGARKAFMMMDEYFTDGFGKSASENKVYRKAVLDLITDDIRYTEMYMSGQDVMFRNHERDKKGKLTKCEAYFYERLEIRREVKE